MQYPKNWEIIKHRIATSKWKCSNLIYEYRLPIQNDTYRCRRLGALFRYSDTPFFILSEMLRSSLKLFCNASENIHSTVYTEILIWCKYTLQMANAAARPGKINANLYIFAYTISWINHPTTWISQTRSENCKAQTNDSVLIWLLENVFHLNQLHLKELLVSLDRNSFKLLFK